MIPLNKPKIYNRFTSGEKQSPEIILRSIYSKSVIDLLFSARQGLDIIYREIYKKNGACTVAVSPLTCFDALYPVINNGHTIQFVDVNEQTFNMDEHQIPENIDVIQAIHFGGNPQNMELIESVSRKSSTILVEDCAQAFGSSYKGKPLGEWGSYSAFSLMKNLYAIAGGFVLSDKELKMPELVKSGSVITLYRTFKRYFESNCSYDNPLTRTIFFSLLKLKPESTSFVFSKYTINNTIYRSINKQLEHHQSLIAERKGITRLLLDGIKHKNLVPQKVDEKSESSFTRLIFRMKEGDTRDYINRLREKKIWASHLSQNSLSTYQPDVFHINEFKDAAEKAQLDTYRKIHDKIISLPISPALNNNEIDYIIEQVNHL